MSELFGQFLLKNYKNKLFFTAKGSLFCIWKCEKKSRACSVFFVM